jgi:hypothetical protein
MKLEDIKTADLFATPPNTWWGKWICRIIGTKTFHWGMFIAENDRGWVITESIGKGVALTRFDYPRAYIYRIKGIREVDCRWLVSIVADYGAYPYDWEVAFRTAIWWLVKHYLGKAIPIIKDEAVNCQEWVVLIAYELGVRLIPDNEYPMCTNLENSPYLEELGEFQE